MSKLTQSYVRELFNYDPITGKLTWKVLRQGARIGEEVGTLTPKGRVAGIDSYRYRVSRIIWLWVYNYWPEGPPNEVVDHIDLNPFNNRLNNLRLQTTKQNARNRGVNINNVARTAGIKRHYEKYMARITVDGKTIYLGLFPTLEEAVEARKQAEKEYWK